jgi:hypothetical protein
MRVAINPIDNKRLIGTQSTDLVGTSTGTTHPSSRTSSSGDDLPLVSSDSGNLLGTNGDPETDIPSPTDDPAAYAAWVKTELDSLTPLFENYDTLKTLASHGDTAAKKLVARLDKFKPKYDSLTNWQSAHADWYLSNGRVNPDIDGDGLTNDYEKQIGTDATSNDTDGDGLTDAGELALQKIVGYEWMDPTNADANHDGRIDGSNLPDRILARYSTTPPVRSNSTDTPGDTTTPPDWEVTVGQYQQVNVADGNQTIEGTGDVVINASGNARNISKDGTSLKIETDQGTIVIKNFFDAQGNPARKVDFNGKFDSVTFDNRLSPDDLQGIDTDNDGVVNFGLHIEAMVDADNIDETPVDPFNGAVPIVPGADGEIVYDLSQVNGSVEFDFSEKIDGQEVKQNKMRKDTNGDRLIDAMDSHGTVLKTFRLTNVGSKIDNYQIKFKLADNGQLFDGTDMTAWVTGGNGDDMVWLGGGYADGGNGTDTLLQQGQAKSVTFYGGSGDDILRGGDAKDYLDGGSGMDIIDSGGGVDTDAMIGGTGSDVIIGRNADGHYRIDGGSGDTDLSNVSGPNASLSGIDVGPSQRNSVIEHLRTRLADSSLTGAARDADQNALEQLSSDAAGAADQMRDLVLSYLGTKTGKNEENYGIQTGADWGDINGGLNNDTNQDPNNP